MKNKILIISEDQDFRTDIKKHLDPDYRMILTNELAQGLNILKNDDAVGLIIAPWCDEESESQATLKAIRQVQPSLPVLLIPSAGMPGAARPLPDDPNCQVLQKPFRSQSLRECVAKALGA